jgi:PEP-CTERM motif
MRSRITFALLTLGLLCSARFAGASSYTIRDFEFQALGINNQDQILLDGNRLQYSDGSYSYVPGVPDEAFLNGLNDTDQFVGFTQKDTSFVLSAGVVTPIPAAGRAFAYGINNSEQVVGTYFAPGHDDFHPQGFVYQDGVFTPATYPGAHSTQLLAISNAGAALGVSDLAPGGFLYKDGIFTDLHIPVPGTLGFSLGINALDEIVGSFFDAAGKSHGFIYSYPQRVFDVFDLPYAEHTQPTSINDRGLIAGIGVNDESFGFVATPTPEPASFLLLGLGFGAIAGNTVFRKRIRSRLLMPQFGAHRSGSDLYAIHYTNCNPACAPTPRIYRAASSYSSGVFKCSIISGALEGSLLNSVR